MMSLQELQPASVNKLPIEKFEDQYWSIRP